MNPLTIRLLGDASSYLRMLNLASQALHRFTDTVSYSFQLAAETEMVELQLGVMLRGFDRGRQMMEDLLVFAAQTPLRLPETQNAARTLLQFGLAGEDIIPTLRLLGDVTGGDEARFTRMAMAFGRVYSHGRLMGRELVSMITNGFNPLLEISERTGFSLVHLRDIMRRGQITYDMVRNAFISATSAGGRFNNMMELQSQTAQGLWSTLADYTQMVFRQIGKDVIELFFLKDIMRVVTEVAKMTWEWLKNGDPAVKILVYTIMLLSFAFLSLIASLPFLIPLLSLVIGAFAGLMDFLLSGTGVAVMALAAALLVLGLVLIDVGGGLSAVMTAGRQMLGGFFSVFTGRSPAEPGANPNAPLPAATQMGINFAQNLVAAWQWIADAARITWGYVRAYTAAFTAWAAPYVLTALGWIAAAWAWVSDGAATAWTSVMGWASFFLNWAVPIFGAFMGYMSAVFGVIGVVAGLVWEGITIAAGYALEGILTVTQWLGFGVNWIWQQIFNGADITWAGVAELIIGALIAAEFGIRNFGSVWDYVVLGIALSITEWKNLLLYLFVDVMPALLDGMVNMWMTAWESVVNLVGEVFSGLSAENLWDLITGDLTLDQFQERFMELFNRAEIGIAMPVIAPRVEGADEAVLRAEYERVGRQLGETWDEFYVRRRAEIDAMGLLDPLGWLGFDQAAMSRVAYESGFTTEDDWQKGKKAAQAKRDATGYYTAEAQARIRAYMDALEGSSNATNIQTNLMNPRQLPMVDVPGHSLYMIYDMPDIDLQLVLLPPTDENVADVMQVLADLAGGMEQELFVDDLEQPDFADEAVVVAEEGNELLAEIVALLEGRDGDVVIEPADFGEI